MPILFCLLLTLIATAPAHAAARLQGPERVVAAGERVELSWSGLSERADEVELEWSLAGGRWLRLSPELDARTGRYEWRVPSGAAGAVRVRLCAGGEHEEWVAAECGFEVRGDAPAGPAPGAALDEWWDLGAHAATARPHALAPRTCELAPASPPVALAPAPAPALAAPRLAAGTPAPAAGDVPCAPTARAPAFHAPRSSPLRN